MSTTLLSTQTFTFRSDYNMCDFNELNPHYNVTILAELKQYSDGKKYYYINYTYEFVANSDLPPEENAKFAKHAHPFFGFTHLDSDAYVGEIIYCNKMTEQMVEHLLMSKDELSKVCGMTDVNQYRKLIMCSLANFWD